MDRALYSIVASKLYYSEEHNSWRRKSNFIEHHTQLSFSRLILPLILLLFAAAALNNNLSWYDYFNNIHRISET